MKNSSERTADDVLQAVRKAGQDHVLRWWDELDDDGRERLIGQLRRVDFDLMKRLAEDVKAGRFERQPDERAELPDLIRLPQDMEDELERENARHAGEALLRDGRVAALTVAGGQGTRLGFDGPKGTFPIGPVSGKSLFHIHADRIAAARARYRNDVPWYIMTSDATHEPTRAFFERHAFFGLPPEEVHFFRQGMLPALDREFRLAPVAKDRILLSPDGHGGVFAALLDTGMLEDMERRGIEEISYFQVDNPLVPAVDPVFIGFHHRKGAEMSNKAMWKREPEEPLGAFVKIGDTLAVREYSDLSKEQQHARNDSGELIYGLGSPAIHMIRTDFARRMAEREDSLPFHLAEKRSPVLNAQGEVVEPEEKNVYKFEKFIFDALAHAERSVILEIDRAKEFSPVKNGSGSDSPETARADMTRLYAEWLEEAGVSVPRDERGEPRYAIEISPRAAPDREALLHDVRPSLEVDGPLYLGEEPA